MVAIKDAIMPQECLNRQEDRQCRLLNLITAKNGWGYQYECFLCPDIDNPDMNYGIVWAPRANSRQTDGWTKVKVIKRPAWCPLIEIE